MTEDEWVDRLLQAMHTEEIIVFGELDGSADPDAARTWRNERTIPANAIRRALLQDDLKVPPMGLRVSGARVVGKLNLDNARVPCRVALTRCSFTDPLSAAHCAVPQLALNLSHVPGIQMDGLVVTGGLHLRGLTSTGEIRAVEATIGGQLVMSDANLANPLGPAVMIDGTQVSGGWFCDGLASSGFVSALGTTVGTQISMQGATLTNEGGVALAMDGARIGGGWFCTGGFKSVGSVRALGVQIGGELSMRGAILANVGKNALSLDGARIGGGWHCTGGFISDGTVRAVDATILGAVNMRDATFRHQGSTALILTGAHLGAGWYCNREFRSIGAVRAKGAVIDGDLVMNGAALFNLGSDALSLDGARIRGDWRCLGGFTSSGAVVASRVTVEGQVAMTGARLTDSDVALSLDSARIRLLNLDGVENDGLIVLDFAEIATLTLAELGTSNLRIRGWHLTEVSGSLLDRNLAMQMMNTSPEFSPQPWHELAAVYDRHGETADAKWLRWQAARSATKGAKLPTRFIRWGYGGLAGYGYYPLLAAVWLVAAIVGGFLLGWFNQWAFTPVDDVTASAGFSPLLYAVASLIPAVSLAGADRWIITSWWVALSMLGLKLFAWLQVAILLAGLTGLLRKA